MNSKTILLTGESGFLGKALKQRLQNLGHTVLGLSRSSGGDITNPQSFDCFTSVRIDIIYHLAACTDISKSWQDPSSFYYVNTMGTQNVLDFCRKKEAHLIYLSSYVYGEPTYLPIDETHPVQPANPYTHSKYLAEELCRFYATNFALSVTIVRPFNIYGTGQDNSFLIPTLINAILHKVTIEIRSLKSRRDFLYIDDAIDALILLAAKGKYDVYNLASGISHSVEEIIVIMQSIAGTDKNINCKNNISFNEVLNIEGNISRISSEYCWKPKHSIYDGFSYILTKIKKHLKMESVS